MTFAAGWEREYSRAIKDVSAKPVLAVGRINYPDVAENLIASGDADAVLLGRQMFADEQWMTKVKEGREQDIRPCVAANYCWRAVTRGARVQCIYNPVVGREGIWGARSMTRALFPKRVLVIGAGPAGLEYARIAAARGNHVIVYEREREVGGHVRAYGALPHRGPFRNIAVWLEQQAVGNGATIKTECPVTDGNIDQVLAAERPDHIVVATGAHYRRDGFQGQTGKPLPGWETGNCVTWDEVALGKARASGEVLVIDEMADAAGPLTAVKLAGEGARVRIVTKWPTVGSETAPDVYLHWILTYIYEADVEQIPNHFVRSIDGTNVQIFNIYQPGRVQTIHADAIVMATARTSENSLYHLLRRAWLERRDHWLCNGAAHRLRSDL